jgi:cyclopropane fatty-acyl-phospholipid synthase-like methyltransferase
MLLMSVIPLCKGTHFHQPIVLFLPTVGISWHTEDWYSTWFNTRYYHLLYGNRNAEEAYLCVHHLVDYLKLPKGSRVLDAGCGKGRHAGAFAAEGMHITGIDLSAANIQSALETYPDIDFYVHDMRRLFRVNYFDAIVNLYTSFGYFQHPADDQRTITAFANGLQRGGTLVIDFLNSYKVMQSLDDIHVTVEDVHFTISKRIENGFLFKHIEIVDADKHYTFTERIRILYQEDFIHLFRKAGLTEVDVFGNYTLSTFDKHASDRLILVARKS